MKFDSNLKVITIVVAAAIISYAVLATLSFNDSASSSPVEFDNIRVMKITQKSATIIGTTTIPVDCQVAYGIGDQLINTASDSDMMEGPHTEHLVVLSGLTPNTEYSYKLVAKANGKTYFSDLKTFVTL